MAMSDYLENAVLNHVLVNTPFSSPTNVYLALFTSDPTDANTGTEVSGGGYERQKVTFGTASGGTVTNTKDVVFPETTAAWGTVTHFGLYDAATGGNLLFHGALPYSVDVEASQQIVIRAGNLSVSMD